MDSLTSKLCLSNAPGHSFPAILHYCLTYLRIETETSITICHVFDINTFVITSYHKVSLSHEKLLTVKGKYQGKGIPYSPGRTFSRYHVNIMQRKQSRANIPITWAIVKLSSGRGLDATLFHWSPTPRSQKYKHQNLYTILWKSKAQETFGDLALISLIYFWK